MRSEKGMKEKKKHVKILFISQEIFPYLPESEVALHGRYTPQAMQERGRETRTFMPKFGIVNERRNQLHEVIRLSGMNLIINDTDHPLVIKVASIQSARMQIYFIDNEDFFSRRNTITDENGVEYPDNDERTIFFTRGVMETIKKLRWTPDVIHCMGWMSALAPLYIKKAYSDDPFFRKAKVIYSIFNDPFEQPFRPNFAKNVLMEGIQPDDLKSLQTGQINFEALSKLAIDFSDGVIQSSPTVNTNLVKYAQENNIPFLPYIDVDDTRNDEYLRFYESL